MNPSTFAIEICRTIVAPRDFVWHAWTETEHVKCWYRPDESWSTVAAEIDLRPGGEYRIGLKPPVGPAFYETGVFLEVKQPELLIYTLRFEGTHLQFGGAHLDSVTGGEMEAYETTITVRFKELRHGSTEALVTHEGYRSEEDRDRHREGWPRFLEQFSTYCRAAWQGRANR